MEYSLAPMEGLTGFIVRNAFRDNFGNIDKYYTPFIPYAKRFNKKIARDIDPENNKGINLIPQVMSNKSREILELEEKLGEYGYGTININIGCPSGTVVPKKRGAGFLSIPEELDRCLYEVFEKSSLKVSVKTRVGMKSPEEWQRILDIYKKYPIEELIVHPRVREDFYKGSLHMETFTAAYQQIDMSKTILCYNGDLVSREDYKKVAESYPKIENFMMGRGLFVNPGMISQIKGENIPQDQYKQQIKAFLDQILDGYLQIFSGEKDAIGHMKEIWCFLCKNFVDSDQCWKKMKKVLTMPEYKLAVNQILAMDMINK